MIPTTNLQKDRIVDQISANVIGLQRDIRANATAHKAMAQAQSPDLITLQGFLTDCISEYQRRLQWCTDLRADPIRRQRLLDALTDRGWTESDVTDIYDALTTIVNTCEASSKASYVDIATTCDSLLFSITPPDSLWPE